VTRFLKNAWYMVGWAEEVPPSGLLARTICEQPLVIYRSDQDQLACLLDRCPHRFAPLSMGRLEGRSLRCGYHGVKFGPDGRCEENPHGTLVSALSVRAFPIVERHKILWTWLGEAKDADPARIPDLGFIDHAPSTALITGYLPTGANHLLLVDNILDLTHADYLHPESLGGGSISRSKAQIEARPDNCLHVQWIADNEAPLPIMRRQFPEADSHVDMWTEVFWHPCGAMQLRVGGHRTGRPKSEAIIATSAHVMTPETATSTHYFYANTRNFDVESVEATRAIAAALRFAFEQQDKPMIEAQQRRIGDADLLALQPALQGSDSASVRARRILENMIAAES